MSSQPKFLGIEKWALITGRRGLTRWEGCF